jgi:ankyrin repeat protein
VAEGVGRGDAPKQKIPDGEKIATLHDPTQRLLEAAENGRPGEIWVLLLHGADPNAKDQRGETALMKAAARGHIGVIEELFTQNQWPVRVNDKDNAGKTALMKAAENGHLAIVRRLLDHHSGRPELDETDKNGQTAMMMAKTKHHRAIVELLKEKGAKE